MNGNESEKLPIEPAAKIERSRASGIRCVADVMTREVVSLTPQHNFADAVNLIANRHFRHFVVIEHDRVVGVVSDRDVLRGLARTDNWQRKEIREFMSVDPVTVGPGTPVSSAISKMLSHRINCLPVIGSDGKPCGILTTTDLLKSYEVVLRSLEEQGCL